MGMQEMQTASAKAWQCESTWCLQGKLEMLMQRLACCCVQIQARTGDGCEGGVPVCIPCIMKGSQRIRRAHG